jgi:hypothetical protein
VLPLPLEKKPRAARDAAVTIQARKKIQMLKPCARLEIAPHTADVALRSLQRSHEFPLAARINHINRPSLGWSWEGNVSHFASGV